MKKDCRFFAGDKADGCMDPRNPPGSKCPSARSHYGRKRCPYYEPNIVLDYPEGREPDRGEERGA